MSVYPENVEIRRTADLSEDGVYRYRLLRRWGQRVPLPFIMLNPSTADADLDDPTIRRCVGFARRLGFDGIGVWNLYAFRATNPAELLTADDPIGPDNDRRLRNLLSWARATSVPVVAGWGAHAPDDRVREVEFIGRGTLWCLGTTRRGAPRHPLYLPAAAELARWAA